MEPATPPSLTLRQFEAAQLADMARFPWAWATQGKASGEYLPPKGKWWSSLEARLPQGR
jgi:hypothetical protein